MSVARHTAYNFVGAVVPVAVSLVTVPLYLKVIGLDRYGVLAIFWSLLSSLDFISLGMGPAVAQFVIFAWRRVEAGRKPIHVGRR